MNVGSFSSVLLKYIYSSYSDEVVAQVRSKDEFWNVETLLDIFDIINNFDSFLYLLISFSFVKVLIMWLPSIFRVFSDMLQQFFDVSTLSVIILSQFVAYLMAFIISLSLNSSFYGMSHFTYAVIRVVLT